VIRSAVIDQTTNTVVNIIIADPSVDKNPDGCVLVPLPFNSPVNINWIYDGSVFIDPNPVLLDEAESPAL